MKSEKKDFICLIVHVNDEPLAFLYGYDYESDPDSFFLDEIATRIEGKGVGKVLIVLLLVYCFELDYAYVTLYTENKDGKKLREFYEHLGFRFIEEDAVVGVVMRYQIEESELLKLYTRVMYPEGGLHPPYLKSDY